MRQSLQAAVIAWIAFAIATTYAPGTSTDATLQIAALGLTALWALHVATFAGRALNKTRVGSRADAADMPEALGRRGAIGVLLRGAAAGAAFSLPLILKPTTAAAFCGQCSKNSDCGVSPCRCTNTAGPGLPVCNECKCS
jgi:hypothetical protein